MLEHDFATHDITEVSFLSRISEKLSRRESFAEYSAWLSKVDHEAALFVKAYSEYAFNRSPLPAPVTHRSQSWHRMLGYTIGESGQSWHEKIREIPVPVRDVVESWVRPIVTMAATACTTADIPIGGSRFLGAPDLPEEFSWPTCALGPLRFQVQIDLREMSLSVATQRYGLPRDGWLVLFAFDDDGKTGTQPGVVDRDDDGNYKEIPDLTHVAYIPATARLVRFTIPAETAHWSGKEVACTLAFGEALDVPHAADTEDPNLTDENVAEWMWGMRGGWESKLMGYPRHCRTDNTSPGPDWLNLFTLGSVEETGWSWCDGEHLDVYVQADGLRNRSFRPFYGYAA